MADSQPASGRVDTEELRFWLREAAASESSPELEPIIERARARIETARKDGGVPGERLDSVVLLADMIEDKDWIAPPSVLPRVLRALLYFVDTTMSPATMSPEGDPCAMTEILAGDLSAELEGFGAFRKLRERLASQRFPDSGQRESRLQQGRRQIRARIQRHAQDRGWLARLLNP